MLTRNILNSFLVLLIVFGITSCSNEPEPINYGKDECEYCRMQITDNKYGAEIVSDKGKIYKFDSLECLVEFAFAKNLVGDNAQSLLITNFNSPETFIDARTAQYVHNNEFRSPMGLNVTAFADNSDVEKFINKNGGNQLSWLEVIELVKQRSM